MEDRCVFAAHCSVVQRIRVWEQKFSTVVLACVLGTKKDDPVLNDFTSSFVIGQQLYGLSACIKITELNPCAFVAVSGRKSAQLVKFCIRDLGVNSYLHQYYNITSPLKDKLLSSFSLTYILLCPHPSLYLPCFLLQHELSHYNWAALCSIRLFLP